MARTPDPDEGDTAEPTSSNDVDTAENARRTDALEECTDGLAGRTGGQADPPGEQDGPSPDGSGSRSFLCDRRDYMRVLGGTVAAAVGIGAASSASAAEYETITVGEDESYTVSLGSGDTLENVLIDVTANRADVHISADGDGWVIRNVGIRGRIDIGDDSPGGDSSSQEGGYNSVFTVDASDGGSGLIENVYLGEGIEPGVDKSALITATQHDGHIDVRNFNCGGFSTTAFYISGFGREGTGGTMAVENSYFENSAGTAHIRPAGNVTIRNCVVTNTNEAVYIPRTFGGHEQAMTSRGIWTSYDGSTTLVENCDIDVREENTCEAPWDYSGGCQANAVWAGDAPIDLVDCEIRGSVGGNVTQSGTGSNPDLSLPEGCPSSAAAAASGGSGSGDSGSGDSGSGDSGSGDSGNGDGGSEQNTISISGGTPASPVDYAFAVDDSVTLGANANGEDSVDGNTGTGVVAGGTDSYRYLGSVTDFSASGEVSVSVEGQSVDPNDLASDGSYRNDQPGDGSGDDSDDGSSGDDGGSGDDSDGADPDLSRSIGISGGRPSDRVQYSFTVSEAVEPGANANVEDSTSAGGATGIVAGGVDDYRFAGEITTFDADGQVAVTVDGESVDPASLGDGGGSGDGGSDDGSSDDGGDSGDGGSDDGGSDDGDSDDGSAEEPGDSPELSNTIEISGGSPSNLVEYSFTASEAVDRGESANAEDSISGRTASGAVAGGTDGYEFAGQIANFEATGDVSVTVNGEAVDPSSLGDSGGSDDGSSGDEGSDDSDGGDSDPSRSITLSGGSPANSVSYAFTVTGSVEAGPSANSEDAAAGASASGLVAGGTDDYHFAGEIATFHTDGDVSVTIDGESVDPASLGDGGSGGDDANDDSGDGAPEEPADPPEPTNTIRISGGSPSNPIDYSFTASEAVDRGRSANAEDSVSGRTATGVVAGGTDGYEFAGQIANFEAAGDVSVTVDGEAVDPSSLG